MGRGQLGPVKHLAAGGAPAFVPSAIPAGLSAFGVGTRLMRRHRGRFCRQHAGGEACGEAEGGKPHEVP